MICLDEPCILSLGLCDVSGDHSVCFCSAGGCQKRLREDVGSDDRDFIKRMKGDFVHRLACLKESQVAQMIEILFLSPLKHYSGLVC